jgi:hypothetical protein
VEPLLLIVDNLPTMVAAGGEFAGAELCGPLADQRFVGGRHVGQAGQDRVEDVAELVQRRQHQVRAQRWPNLPLAKGTVAR